MKRKVVGVTDVPYDRFPDGKPKTYQAWELECGHTIRIHVHNTQRVRPDFISLDMPTSRLCPKCTED